MNDWRDGLVVLSPDHVYGATALTAEEWAALDRRLHGEFFLIERTTHKRADVAGVLFPSRAEADEALRHYAEMSPAAFEPAGPLRMVVTEAPK